VSRSVPAIIKEMQARGITRWSTSIYRASQKHTMTIRCKTAEELNAALEGERSAIFVVANPDCWIVGKDATSDMGDSE